MTRDIEIVNSHVSQPPVDFGKLFDDLGLDYISQPMKSGESGRIEKRNGKYAVFINSEEGEGRRRFTAAHELAHYLLHRDMLETTHLDRLFSDDGNPSAPFQELHEVQANKLAAKILMPEGLIRKRWNEGQRNPSELAREFKVSPAAIQVRLKTLRMS